MFSYSECTQVRNEIPFVYHGGDCCVFKFDHSCNWCANNIGYCNRFYFIAFLALQADSSLRFTISGLKGIRKSLTRNKVGIYDILDGLASIFANAVALVTSAITLVNNLLCLMRGHSLRSYGIQKSVVRLIKQDQLRVA